MTTESQLTLPSGGQDAAKRLMQFIGTSLQNAALASGASAWLARRRMARRIVMLHGVGGDNLRPADLKQALLWLAQNFRIVTLDDMVRDLAAGKPAGADGEMAITFDDGLRNQGNIAYPILKDLGIPATIFVCPGLIDCGQWQWNHEARARLRRLSPAQRSEWAHAHGMADADIEAIIRWMKQLPLQPRLVLEASLRDATPGFAPTVQERQAYDPMNWSELAALDPGLITIGSHTVTHPILSALDEEQIQYELQDSRLMLEARLARPVELFCYPNGSHDVRVRRIASQVYRAAVTTEEGLVPEPVVDAYAIPRIPVAAQIALLAWRMHRPLA